MMPEESEYLGREIAPPTADAYMEPTLYRVKCRCLRCGHEYKSRPAKSIPKNNPPCPKKACKEAIMREQMAKEAAHVETMIETGQTPGHIGENVQVKAIDQTAQIVMEDFGMTDLKDNVRQGESMVPALTPRQQEMSKNFWGGGKIKDRRKPTYLKGIGGPGDQSLAQKAMSGQFLPNIAGSVPKDSITGDNILTKIHGERFKPPVNIIYDTDRAKK